MNRVTIVNLAGRAWHVDEAGADALAAWLDDARTRLAADPDRDEILLDFERAIADRAASAAPGERDVVSAQQVDEILSALGTVEPAIDETDDQQAAAGDDGATTTQLPRTDVPLRDRRLYRLTDREDAKLGGVCAGLGAYLNVDVTVVRVLFVVLTLLTSGAMLLVYVAMWLLVPEAVTAEQRAEARGSGITAEEMRARARVDAGPALTRLGSRLGRFALVLGHVVRWVMLILILTLLAAWAFAMSWLFIDGGELMDVFDQGTSTWLVGLWLTCLAWIPVSMLLAVERVLAWLTRPAHRGMRSGSAAVLSATLVVSFVLAAIGVNAIPATSSHQIRSLSDGHGRIELFDQEICIDVEDGATSASNRSDDCRGADLIIR